MRCYFALIVFVTMIGCQSTSVLDSASQVQVNSPAQKMKTNLMYRFLPSADLEDDRLLMLCQTPEISECQKGLEIRDYESKRFTILDAKPIPSEEFPGWAFYELSLDGEKSIFALNPQGGHFVYLRSYAIEAKAWLKKYETRETSNLDPKNDYEGFSHLDLTKREHFFVEHEQFPTLQFCSEPRPCKALPKNEARKYSGMKGYFKAGKPVIQKLFVMWPIAMENGDEFFVPTMRSRERQKRYDDDTSILPISRYDPESVVKEEPSLPSSSVLDEVWSSRSENDAFTNEITHTATGDSGSFSSLANRSFVRRDGYDFGVRCDVAQDGEKDFMLTFTVDGALATPSSRAYVYVKVDENAPIELIGKLFSNSYRSGYVLMNSTNQEKIEKFVAQGIAGNKLMIRVHDERRSEIEDYLVMLKGFTKHTAKAANACGVLL